MCFDVRDTKSLQNQRAHNNTNGVGFFIHTKTLGVLCPVHFSFTDKQLFSDLCALISRDGKEGLCFPILLCSFTLVYQAGTSNSLNVFTGQPETTVGLLQAFPKATLLYTAN